MTLTQTFSSNGVTLKWVPNGRIIVIDEKSNKTITIQDYSKSLLNKMMKLINNSTIKTYRAIDVYLNSQYYETTSCKHIEIEFSDTGLYLIPRETETENSLKATKDGSVRTFQIGKKAASNFKRMARYEIRSDYKLEFIEEVTFENLFRRYDFPVLTIY